MGSSNQTLMSWIFWMLWIFCGAVAQVITPV
jgi:hypothetical protein